MHGLELYDWARNPEDKQNVSGFCRKVPAAPGFRMIRRLLFYAGGGCRDRLFPTARRRCRLFWSLVARGGPDAARLAKGCPWIKGVFVAIQWKDAEPADNQFDWKSFDETFARYADAEPVDSVHGVGGAAFAAMDLCRRHCRGQNHSHFEPAREAAHRHVSFLS